MFVENFKNVYEDAEASGFKKLKLFSEKKRSLFQLPDISGKNSYNPKNFLHFRKKFEERFCGFLLCSIDDLAVFNDWSLGKAVETRARDLGINNAREISELIKVCKVLLSEAFAKKLLTNALVEEFYEDYENSDSFFDVRLDPEGVNDETHILRLEAEYTHQRYSEGNEHVFKAHFRFSYDFDQHKFRAEEDCLKLLQFDDFEINPEPDEKVIQLRENPLEGRSNRDVYGMKARGKAFVKRNKDLDFEQSAEKKSNAGKHTIQRQNFSGKHDVAQHGFGAEEGCLKLLQFDDFEINLEPDEKVMRLRENLLGGRLNRNVWGMKARKKALENFSGKRPRSFNSSEDEASEENFKRKKEERSALGTNREM